MPNATDNSGKSFTKLDAMALGADCGHCPLRVAGKLTPSFGTGSNGIAFVGEAPGVQEAREGRPFIGPSGRLLKLVSENVGVDRDESFLSNACLCRPPDGGTPPKLAIAACRPRLLRELSARGTRTVVALGNSAALSVLGVEGVTKLRVGLGRKSPYPELEGVRVIPTIHPAACLRQSDMFPSLVRDVGKILGGKSGSWDPPEYRVHDDPVVAIEALGAIQRRGGRVVVDIEVDIDKDTASDHPDRYELLCVGIYQTGLPADIIGECALRDGDVLSALADALRACTLTNQNIMFDLSGLFPHCGALRGHSDTFLASYALDERPGVHDLGQQGIEILGTPDWKAEVHQYVKGKAGEGLEHYHGYGRIPRPILYKYNAYDLKVTDDLWLHYEPLLEKVGKPKDWPRDKIPYEWKSLRYLHDFLVEAGNELMYLELNGIYVDRNYNLQLLNSYEDDLEVLRTQIRELLDNDGWEDPATKGLFNPNSPQQVKRLMNDHWGFRLGSTDEDTIKKVMEQIIAKYGDKAYEDVRYNFCDLLLQHRKAAKMYGTYVKGIRKRLFRGKIHANYKLPGTTTGRLASRNPNMQNVPRMKKIKAQFVPKPNKPPFAHNVFVQADYKQAEARVLAWLAQDEELRDLLNDPERDLFDELTPRLRPDLPSKAEAIDVWGEEYWKDTRVRVKAFFYGLSYGRKPGSIAAEYRMPFEEANQMSKNLFATFPNVAEWQQWVKNRVKSGQDLISPFGRHRRFHLITEENWFSVQNEALAFLPQSTSSDVTLRAFVRLRREFRGTGVFLRNIVHDSILADCPPDMATHVAERLDYHMVASAQELVGDYINFGTDVDIGNNWGEV